jgi:hypothetical protein
MFSNENKVATGKVVVLSPDTSCGVNSAKDLPRYYEADPSVAALSQDDKLPMTR